METTTVRTKVEQVDGGYGWAVYLGARLIDTGTEETYNAAMSMARVHAADLRADVTAFGATGQETK